MAIQIQTTALQLGVGWSIPLYVSAPEAQSGDTIVWSATDSSGNPITSEAVLSFPKNGQPVYQGYCECTVLAPSPLKDVTLQATLYRGIKVISTASTAAVQFIKMAAIGPKVSAAYAELVTTSPPAGDQIVSIEIKVVDAATLPVKNAQVTILQMPGKNGIVIAYTDSAATTEADQISGQQMWSLMTDSNGEAVFYVTSKSTCNETFQVSVLGDDPKSTDVAFCTIGAEPPLYTAPSTSIDESDRVVVTNFQRFVTFDAYPSPPLVSGQKIFIAVNNEYASTPIQQENFTNELTVPVIKLKQGDDANTNQVAYYVQERDNLGGDVTASRVFHFGLTGDAFNQPDPSQDRVLPVPGTIPSMGTNDVITQTTLMADNGFSVVVPKLSGANVGLDGLAGVISVYLNGFFADTTRPNQNIKTYHFFASKTSSITQLISTTDMSGYSASRLGSMDYFYCEYVIYDNSNIPVYSNYIQILMNT